MGGKNLTCFENCDTLVNASVNYSHNRIASLEGCFRQINGDLDISHNQFENLHDVHKHVHVINGNLDVRGNPIASHVLGLLLIRGLLHVSGDAREIHMRDMMDMHPGKVYIKRIDWAQVINSSLTGRELDLAAEKRASNLDEFDIDISIPNEHEISLRWLYIAQERLLDLGATEFAQI